MKLNSKVYLYSIALILVLSLSCSLLNGSTSTFEPADTGTVEVEPTIQSAEETPMAGTPTEQSTQTKSTAFQNTVQLDPEGPWLLLASGGTLFAVNPDGTGPIALLDINNLVGYFPLPEKTASSGGHFAFLTMTDPMYFTELTLNIYTLPDMRVTKQIDLIAPEYGLSSTTMPGDPEFDAARSLVEVSSFAWSPDSSQLAFMGIIEGPTSDLYLYDLDTDSITRLTDGPSNGIRPSWSPDGTWIVHTGVSTLGTGAGYGMEGIWAARADSSSVLSLYDLAPNGDEIIHGWISPVEFVVSSWNAAYGDFRLRVYNLETSEVTPIHEGAFTSAVLDTALSTMLVYVDRYSAEAGDDQESGFFLYHIPTASRTILEQVPQRFSWSPEANRYLILTENKNSAMKPGGDEILLPDEIRTFPAFLAGTNRWAAAQGGADLVPGVWAVQSDGTTAKLSEAAFYGLNWTPAGDLILYGSSGLYFSQGAAEPPVQISAEPLQTSESVWLNGTP
ncbi:MAG: PD40 domain-containing protein [Anaerolineales bacterium]|nr:PD40 domain-containing protein [Anaerolineales bacterium]